MNRAYTENQISEALARALPDLRPRAWRRVVEELRSDVRHNDVDSFPEPTEEDFAAAEAIRRELGR